MSAVGFHEALKKSGFLSAKAPRCKMCSPRPLSLRKSFAGAEKYGDEFYFVLFVRRRKGGRRIAAYPGVVELGLDADHIAFFLELCTENLELRRLERPRIPCQRTPLWFVVMDGAGKLTSRHRLHLFKQSQRGACIETPSGRGGVHGSSDGIVAQVGLT